MSRGHVGYHVTCGFCSHTCAVRAGGRHIPIQCEQMVGMAADDVAQDARIKRAEGFVVS